MPESFSFYDARAREATAEAEAATLDNVRERNLRAAKTWRGLAEHARKVEQDRANAAKLRQERLDFEEREQIIDALRQESALRWDAERE